MKKTYTIAEAVLATLLVLAGCAFTDDGNRIKDEREALESLEHRREDYEARYVIVLNSLERYTGDPKLERERDSIHKKILEINTRILEQRQTFERSVQDWEQKLAQDKLQKEMDEREERVNANKQEGQFDNSR